MQFRKLFSWLSRINELIGILTIIVICLSISYQVVLRFFFNSTLKWVDEISQMMLIAMTFIGLGQIELKDDQIKMELVYTLFPKKEILIKTFSKITTVIFIIALMISEIKFMPFVLGVLQKASRIPVIYIHWLMLYGLVIWLISAVLSLIQIRREAVKGK